MLGGKTGKYQVAEPALTAPPPHATQAGLARSWAGLVLTLGLILCEPFAKCLPGPALSAWPTSGWPGSFFKLSGRSRDSKHSVLFRARALYASAVQSASAHFLSLNSYNSLAV